MEAQRKHSEENGILNKLIYLAEALKNGGTVNADLFIANYADLVLKAITEAIVYLDAPEKSTRKMLDRTSPASKFENSEVLDAVLFVLSRLTSCKELSEQLNKLAQKDKEKLAKFYRQNAAKNEIASETMPDVLSAILDKPVIDTRDGLGTLLTFSFSVR